MKDVLYVTSFSKQLYDVTGRGMIESFVFNKIEDNVLITYEGAIDLPDNDRFIKHNLETNTFLSDWLEENRDIIPIKYGGDAERIDTLWNRRASLWFRKIVSLREAMKFKNDYKAVVFCDCDCIFHKKIPTDFILKTFEGNDFFYHRGPHREAIESGFMGFNLEKNGEQFINLLIECFSNKNFRKYNRWDDGYVITQVLEEKEYISGIDVVKQHNEVVYSHVVPFGPFANYVSHHKGSHTRKYGIFENDK